MVSDTASPIGDLIFVHGLGGTAWKTWCWNRDRQNFWPVWLADEDVLPSFRIFTYGYNSNFKGAGTNLNIHDFAKGLLLQMLTFSGEAGQGKAPIGSGKIIFVVHSMGGLVVKKAYILGQQDVQFARIISQVFGMVFLATPHRGAQYAKILNNILSTAPLGVSSKAYITDLQSNSGALQDIGEQFRHICGELALVSFFETLKTSVGLGKVLNTLKYLASRIQPADSEVPQKHTISASNFFKRIKPILGVREAAEDDLLSNRNKALRGTCKWLTRTPTFLKWMSPEGHAQRVRIFWLLGTPATGKTVLATAIIDHIQSTEGPCQYHFFVASHQTKRTTAYSLRSIASQLARAHPGFREALIFEGLIFKFRFTKPLYWIFDAIDEADTQSNFLNFLLKIQSITPISIFLSSRLMKIPATSASSGSSIIPYFLSDTDTEADIRAYVIYTIRNALPDDEVVQTEITDRVLAKASGSFLWVKLALETLQENWHTQDDVRNTLAEVPAGMMCGHLVSVHREKLVLIHATARQFLLTDTDNARAFINGPEAHSHIALTCLKFLSNKQWRPLFQEYFVQPPSDTKTNTQNYLSLAEKNHPFLGYSMIYWTFHVSKSHRNSEELIIVLKTFLHEYCLSWIEAVALSGNLRYLTRSAQYLNAYAKRLSRRSTIDSLEAPQNLKATENDDPKWITLWAIDFIRIVGKFGPSLVLSPSSIYRDIPPFCPRTSMICQNYGESRPGMLSVAGLPTDDWDDCLANVSVGEDGIASKVLATDAYFITLVSSIGRVVIWHAETCEQARTISVNEYVPSVALNKAGTQLYT
ncbi:hypothetical protein EJ08DRAFT_660211 [Tothia fuscella]|uniref:Nephrocystin 3-like N-terminal domain-containing protein n=1 Tax=Tothia fuscella TaxID=1048955 RepID=A0A9P4NRY8_9PEZI|nr:hypothetical protein EJ08DRAFT_660211 [Tothia fuscella]